MNSFCVTLRYSVSASPFWKSVRPQRVTELSRMLAGVGESEHARSHAAELLDRAANRRAEVAG